jgi:hypothetical protein
MYANKTGTSLIYAVAFFVGASLYTTIWSYFPGSEQLVQLISFGLMFIAGFLSWLSIKRFKSFNALEIFFIGLVSLSVTTSVLSGSDYSLQYSIVFGIFCSSLFYVARALSVDLLINTYAATMGLVISTVLLVDSENLLDALSVTITNHGLLRFTPLGMHPNLTGIVYAGSLFVFTLRILSSDWLFVRIACFACFVVSSIFVVASSARSSFLCLGLALAFWFYFLVRKNKAFKQYLFPALSILLMCVSVFFDRIYSYIADIFEFDSKTRGLDSGGTGRTELWYEGIELIQKDPIRLFFGAGFRSAEQDIIGISLESSYITLVYEVGIIACTLLMIFLFICFFNLLKISRFYGEKGVGAYFVIVVSMIFFIFQSIFNRYLISMGNIYSIFFLLIIFKGYFDTASLKRACY